MQTVRNTLVVWSGRHSGCSASGHRPSAHLPGKVEPSTRPVDQVFGDFWLACSTNTATTSLHLLPFNNTPSISRESIPAQAFSASISSQHTAAMSPIASSAKDAQKESTAARILGAGMYNQQPNGIVSIARILTAPQALPVSPSSPSSTPSTPSPSA